MVGVVNYGTGTAASLAPIGVAGKTGTAELEDTTDDEDGDIEQPPGSDTDAWFTAYAPVKKPEDRGGSPARAQRRRRRDGGAGGAGRAPGRARATRGRARPGPLRPPEWISSSSGRFSPASSGKRNSSIEPAVGPSWARLPFFGMQLPGSSSVGWYWKTLSSSTSSGSYSLPCVSSTVKSSVAV